MEAGLKILHLAEAATESERVRGLLREEGLLVELDRVQTLADFQQALEQDGYQLVLSGYSCARVDGLEALRRVRERRPELPFIFLSQTPGEELAVEALKQGATDYVLKQDSRRLVPAVRRALREAEEHQEHSRLEAELRANQERFQETFENAEVGMAHVGPRGEWLEVNQKLCEIVGYSREELLQGRFQSITHPEDRAADQAQLERMLRGESDTTAVQKRYFGKDGRLVWVHLTARARRDNHGQLLYCISVIQDITEQKRAEQALQESEERFRAVVTASSDVVFRMSPDWSLMQELEGRNFVADTQVPTRTWLQKYVPPEDQAKVVAAVQEGIRTQSIIKLEHRVVRLDGSIGWAFSRVVPLVNGQGQIVEWFGAATDVTERKQAEALLRTVLRTVELERLRLAAVFEALPAGVAISDAEGKILQFNAALARIWGAPPSPKSVADYGQWRGYWVETGRPLAAEDWAMARALRTGQPVAGDVVEIEKFDGSGRATIINAAAPIRDANGQILGGVVAEVDITGQKRAEAALRVSEQRERQRADELTSVVNARDEVLAQLEAMLTNAPVGFAFFDREHRFVRVNPFMALQFDGLPVEAHLGRPIREILPVTAQIVEPLLDTIFTTGEPIENVVVTREAPSTPGEQRHWLTAWFPVRTSDGRIPWVGVAVMELTQQKRAEQALHKAREALARANADLERRVDERTRELREAITELEQMSYSMIHDLRAPLRAIQSFGGILAEDPESQLSEEARELVTKMRRATSRMDHLIVDVLNYSKVVRGELPLGPVDVGALVRGIMETYPGLEPAKAEVRVGSDLPWVVGNQAALTQCLAQLLQNAVQFAKPGQRASIEVCGERQANGWARIIVEDKGIGIAPEHQGKVFGIFQRLSGWGGGTGMGLAIVKKAVERMGGRVGVDSELGKGSRFWLELRGTG